MTGGYISGSGANLFFSLPCIAASGVSCAASGSWSMQVRYNGYLVGTSTEGESVAASHFSITRYETYLYVVMELNTALSSYNNYSVSVRVMDGTVAFS